MQREFHKEKIQTPNHDNGESGEVITAGEGACLMRHALIVDEEWRYFF
jgi:hypothetical protein